MDHKTKRLDFVRQTIRFNSGALARDVGMWTGPGASSSATRSASVFLYRTFSIPWLAGDVRFHL